MVQKKKVGNPMLKAMGILFEKSEKSKLDPELFIKHRRELKLVKDYFNVNSREALILSLVFVINYKGDSVNFSELIQHLNCLPTQLLEFASDFRNLNDRGILLKGKYGPHPVMAFSNDHFWFSRKISEAIIQNQPFPERGEEKLNTVLDLLQKVMHLRRDLDNESISVFLYRDEVSQLLEQNSHFPLIGEIAKNNIDNDTAAIFLLLVWYSLSGNESFELGQLVSEQFENSVDRIRFMQGFLTGSNKLLKLGWVELKEASFFTDVSLKLTEEVCHKLESWGIEGLVQKSKNAAIIRPSDITARELFYNAGINERINHLQEILKQQKLDDIRRRMKEKGLKSGITVLLYGPPGTGKTETALQLARATGRSLMKVDISNSRSMWFGESEKIIKKIFTDYRQVCCQGEQLPILFFNEADALISSRRKISSEGTSQTENIMQNIILEELENFEGIFIATTNLQENMDAAFERRFLFKLELPKPDTSVIARIWKSRLEMLSEDDCQKLARQFLFSGAQIDNVVRKAEMQHIISGDLISLQMVTTLCSEEKLLETDRSPIGFNKN